MGEEPRGDIYPGDRQPSNPERQLLRRLETISRKQDEFENTLSQLSEQATTDRLQHIEQARTAKLESDKMMFEIAKLVATIATGVVVAISVISASLIPEPDNVRLLWASYGSMLVSISFSITFCVAATFSIFARLSPFSDESGTLWQVVYWVFFVFSVSGIPIGLLLFAEFIGRESGGLFQQ